MTVELESQIIAALQALFDRFGWFGVAGVIALENATGLTPSEVILGLAGWMLLAAHNAPFPMVFIGALYAAFGSAAGASATYWLARLGGRPMIDRAAHWFRIHPRHITRAEMLFQRWGPGLVLFGRVLPGVRTLVTIPAGLVRMPFLRFAVFTFTGAYVWCALLIGSGYVFGHEWLVVKDLVRQSAPWLFVAFMMLGGLGLIARRRVIGFALPAESSYNDERIDYDFSRFKLRGHDQATTIMRLREFDRRAQDFLARHPEAVVVHIGCGLDTRFERVDNGQVEWYDMDLSDVIDLRRKLIDETARCRFLGCSVFDKAWLDTVSMHTGRPFLFLAEGVLPYFEEAQVKDLVLILKERFPGAELVFDAMTPFILRLHNLELVFSKVSARLHWGMKHGRDLESWSAGIRLLDEWFYFERPEPRLGAARLMRYCPPLAKGVGIFHYQLGNCVG